MPTKNRGFCVRLGPHGKYSTRQGLLESTNKNGGSHTFLALLVSSQPETSLPLPFHNIQCRGNHAFLKLKLVVFIFFKNFFDVRFIFPVTSLVSEIFAPFALVLCAHYVICSCMFTVGFQRNFSTENS